MKRILLINAHVALLCFGTVLNAIVFAYCWTRFHGLVAGLLYIGVFIWEWIVTLLTQRSGAAWTKKRYITAYICCYVLLAIVMSITVAEKPLFRDVPEAVVFSPIIDSVAFTITALFFHAVYSWATGLVIRKRPDNYDEFREYYYSQRFDLGHGIF